jgi:hypothetical protein
MVWMTLHRLPRTENEKEIEKKRGVDSILFPKRWTFPFMEEKYISVEFH